MHRMDCRFLTYACTEPSWREVPLQASHSTLYKAILLLSLCHPREWVVFIPLPYFCWTETLDSTFQSMHRVLWDSSAAYPRRSYIYVIHIIYQFARPESYFCFFHWSAHHPSTETPALMFSACYVIQLKSGNSLVCGRCGFSPTTRELHALEITQHAVFVENVGCWLFPFIVVFVHDRYRYRESSCIYFFPLWNHFRVMYVYAISPLAFLVIKRSIADAAPIFHRCISPLPFTIKIPNIPPSTARSWLRESSV